MNGVYFDAQVADDVRRRRLYDGELYVYSPRASTRELCALARELTENAFAPHDPRYAQREMPVEQFVEILADLKPRFIHHPKAKTLIRGILEELGCDLQKTFFDVPRLRTATAGDYLKAGLAYAFKPHRDTWYSTPPCQLNWWLPVYPIEVTNCMAIHPGYWNRPIKNSSSEFNYQQWQSDGRKAAKDQVRVDARRQSEALEPVQLDPQLRLIVEPGGLIVFSAAHLHSTVPNTSDCTRISIDFRTVHLDELINFSGAPNLDSACTGTTIHDYLRGSDFASMPADIQEVYERQCAVNACDGVHTLNIGCNALSSS